MTRRISEGDGGAFSALVHLALVRLAPERFGRTERQSSSSTAHSESVVSRRTAVRLHDGEDALGVTYLQINCLFCHVTEINGRS